MKTTHHLFGSKNSCDVDTISLVIISISIGGKLFQVSKELLMKYPNTMLSMVASVMETNNQDEPIFMDGNSERFPYIIDYMRYQSVVLPDHIAKDFFQKDLDYYGFENIQFKNIETLSQNSKRKERLALIEKICLCHPLTNMRVVTLSNQKCINNGNDKADRLAVSRGLCILCDAKHEEHQLYRSSLQTMLSQTNVDILWIKSNTYPRFLVDKRNHNKDSNNTIVVKIFVVY
jgi:BTB/POZ domain